MKLYYSKGACSFVQRIIINELKLKCEFIAVDLKAHKTEKGEDYYQINPKGSVPLYVNDQGEALSENATILQYLAETYHNTQLLPPIGDFKRYRILEWLTFITTDLHKGVGALHNPSYPENIRNEILIPNIKKKMAYVELQLKNHPYIAGDHFTLPDAYLFLIIRWLILFKFNLQEWPNISRYFEELKKRPAIQISLEQENQ
jgi:glutathione S-transferase